MLDIVDMSRFGNEARLSDVVCNFPRVAAELSVMDFEVGHTHVNRNFYYRQLVSESGRECRTVANLSEALEAALLRPQLRQRLEA